jgi:hypothetical protein
MPRQALSIIPYAKEVVAIDAALDLTAIQADVSRRQQQRLGRSAQPAEDEAPLPPLRLVEAETMDSARHVNEMPFHSGNQGLECV